VKQVVLDPIRGEVTHLIVEPDHRTGLGRLVPIELADPGADGVDLACTGAQFDELEVAEDVRFLPGTDGFPGYDADHSLLLPYFGSNITEPVVIDSLPIGEVAVQRGEKVYATDGPIGEVEGLILNRAHRVTHVLLKKGHVFSHRDVAVPIGAVDSVSADGVRLSMSRRDVEGFSEVGVQHPKP
jgi:hypothetical protein